MYHCTIVPKLIIFATENQFTKFDNMTITRTQQDVFNICNLTAAELTAILTSIELSTKDNLQSTT